MTTDNMPVSDTNVQAGSLLGEMSNGLSIPMKSTVSATSSDSPIQLVPLSQLTLSALNVRKTGAEARIEELAELIAADGILQNLAVTEIRRKGKKRPPCFAVVAGGRRLRALQRLQQQGRIPRDYLVPCLVVSDEQAVGVSTAENSGREPMHPADEFEAFRQLVDAGRSIDEVAARFGVDPVVVERRLKLAKVAPEFVRLYREEEINLEHLMALAITDDHEQQRRIWAALPEHNRTPHAIRAGITETEVTSRDHRVRLVTVEEYEKAGGPVRKDLFEDTVYLQDPALLDRLVLSKLEARARELKESGCTWVEVSPRYDYSERARFGRVQMTDRPPTEDEQSVLEKLQSELLSLDYEDEQLSEDDDERRNEIDARRVALQDQLAELEGQLETPNPEQQGKAGALVYLDYSGEICVDDGLLPPEDATDSAGPCEPAKKSKLSGGAHSAALLASLTAHRTLALRAVFSQTPDVALAAIVHGMTLHTFYRQQPRIQSALQFHLPDVRLESFATDLGGSKAFEWMAAQEQHLRGPLPSDPADLFRWLLQQTYAEKLALLAFCAAQSLNAVQTHENESSADALAGALKIDLRRWWTPTGSGYFGRIPKAAILKAVAEGVSAEAAARLGGLKKGQAAEEAEKLLAQSGWMPPFMRGAWACEP